MVERQLMVLWVAISTLPFHSCLLDDDEEEMYYLTTHSTHFYLRLYGVGHMVKDHSDSKRENLLLPHGLLFPISSKGSFIWVASSHRQDHIPQPLLYQSWSTGWNEK